MLERDLQKAIINMARLLGWKVVHFAKAGYGGRSFTPREADTPGFPDLILVRERIVFVELKMDGAYLKPLQREWRDRLQAAGAEWYLWRSEDYREGRPEEILR